VPERSVFEPFIVRLEQLGIPYFVLEVSPSRIERPFLEPWIAGRGLAAEWGRVLAED